MQSQDLARAFVQVLGNEKASKQVFNISGEKYVTFDGLARACAKVILSNTFLNGHTVKELYDFLKCRKLSSMYFSPFDYLLFICFLLGTGWWISWAWDHSLQPEGIWFWQKEGISIPWSGTCWHIKCIAESVKNINT